MMGNEARRDRNIRERMKAESERGAEEAEMSCWGELAARLR